MLNNEKSIYNTIVSHNERRIIGFFGNSTRILFKNEWVFTKITIWLVNYYNNCLYKCNLENRELHIFDIFSSKRPENKTFEVLYNHNFEPATFIVIINSIEFFNSLLPKKHMMVKKKWILQHFCAFMQKQSKLIWAKYLSIWNGSIRYYQYRSQNQKMIIWSKN